VTVEPSSEHNGVMRRARVALLSLVVLAGVFLGWVSCSDGDRGNAPAATSPTSGSSPEPTTVPTTGTGPATETSASPGDSPPTTVAMAEGWGFAVTRPQAGETVGRSMTVCTEISGTSREPVLKIEATLARPGGPDSATSGTGVNVGRDAAVLDFPKASPGRYDLKLRLNVDERSIPGLQVTIPDLRLTPDTPPATCG